MANQLADALFQLEQLSPEQQESIAAVIWRELQARGWSQPRKPAGRRPSGLAAGQFTVPPDFNDPLPDELLDAFEGK